MNPGHVKLGQKALRRVFMSMVLLVSPALFAETVTDPLDALPARVQKITLKNGLRLLILERPASPTVSFAMFIRTGGLDDESGKTGLAHMFEHMLFKGTKTIGTTDYKKEAPLLDAMDKVMERLDRERDKGDQSDPAVVADLETQFQALEAEHRKLLVEEEYWRIFERAGGRQLNASTGYDFTNYVVSLPANQVKLWMVMESDRIRNPVLREFYKERDVVLEERRQRYEDSPRGKLWSVFLAAAFMAHPYGRPIIGWESDISRVTRKDAEDFFDRHYDVSRLVVAIVGGIKTSEVEALARTHLETIPTRRLPARRTIPVEPPQTGERRVEVEFNAEPNLIIGYHRPNFAHPDAAALDVAAEILSSGRTSRFTLSLVEKKKIAVSAWAASSAPGERDPHLFTVGGTPRSPHTAQDLERALLQEIEILKTNGPAPAELEKVKTNLEAGLIRRLSSNRDMANQLAYYECVNGDWAFLLESLRRLKAVTAEDVTRVMSAYLVKSNRTVAVLVKTK